MLRFVVLLLLVANTGYFAWGSGMLRSYGLGPSVQQEPQRLAEQVRADALRVLSAQELQRAEEQARADLAPKECLQAGPLDSGTASQVRKLLEARLPADSWQLDSSPVSARWMVYVGKLPNADALARKRAELAASGLKSEAVRTPPWEPGLSLGLATSKRDADALLVKLSAKGLRNARVVQERAEGQAFTLRLPAVSEAGKAQLGDVQAALGAGALQRCN